MQALLLSPLCPHVCDHVWTMLGNKESILLARYPVADEVDDVAIKASSHLDTWAHRFRVLVQRPIKPKKGDKGPAAAPTRGTIFVSEAYSGWKLATLKVMGAAYEENGKVLPDKRVIMGKLKVGLGRRGKGKGMVEGKAHAGFAVLQEVPEVKPKMKLVMPFVGMITDEVATIGEAALALTMPFNEFELFKTNIKYLQNSLGLQSLEVRPASEGNEKTQNNSSPGKPVLVLE